MRHRSIVITIAMLAFMLIIACIPAFAGDAHLVNIPTNQAWVSGGNEYHDTGYSHAGAKNISVTPVSGIDLFANIRCRILNSNGTVILNSTNGYTVIAEGLSTSPLPIKNGYYNTSIIYFQYSGNSNAAAYAIVQNFGTYNIDTLECW